MKSGQKADPPPAVVAKQVWDPKRGRDSLRVIRLAYAAGRPNRAWVVKLTPLGESLEFSMATKTIRSDYTLRGRAT